MLNKVILIGNLGKDPEIKNVASDTNVANFSIATSEGYKDKQGQFQNKTEWHNIVCWKGLADKAQSWSKGDTVTIEGKLTTRKWQDKDGNDRYTTEVVAHMAKRNRKAGAQGAAVASIAEADDLPF